MDAVIQINDPIIIPPEYFLVRYRLLPNGIFTDLGVQDNDPFTIPSVPPGTYELEVRFVNEDGVVCPPVLTEFTIPSDPPPDDCECMGIIEVYVTRNCDNTATIHVEVDGTDTGACQYEVTYTEFGGFNSQTVIYPQNGLPNFLDFDIPFSNSFHGPSIKITLICCSGLRIDCLDQIITDIRDQDCDCVPPTIEDGWINFDPVTNEYTATVVFSSGGVVSAPYNISYSQIFTTIGDNGTIVQSTPGTYTFPVNPNPPTGSDIVYRVVVDNSCGRDVVEITIIKCSTIREYTAGENYPTSFTMEIAPVTGAHFISFDTFGSPDRLVVEVGGVVVLDTGYIGNVSYQTVLDAALAVEGDPPSTITAVPPGYVEYIYNNPPGYAFAQIKVYGPLPNTNWRVKGKC